MQTAINAAIQKNQPDSLPIRDNRCHDCSRYKICLAESLEGEELDAFNSILRHSKKVNRGEYLYRAGDAFNSFYVIRSGSLKTFMIDEEGHEQILGFSIQGDIVALDGATLNSYPTSAQALETTHICEIPFSRYMELAVGIPALYKKLLNKMSLQIRDEEKHTLLLGTKNAEQRLATLLLSLSSRYAERGFSKHEFNLNMSRRDIGNYLSTAMETVSRLFSRLQSNGLIEVHGKLVYIKNLDKLANFASS